MDAAILSFGRVLAAFCNHVECSSKALSDSVKWRPIPRDSAATSFLQSLERRISTTSSDLNLLYTMAFDTVSFEELLGHCNEVYKVNDQYISQVEERMMTCGYVPDLGLMTEKDERFGADVCNEFQSSTKHQVEEEIFDSISLKNLGLSNASLSALSSEGTIFSSQEIASYSESKYLPSSVLNESTATFFNSSGPSNQATITISVDDYDKLPAFMKNISSWEELQEAVDKINVYLSGNDGPGRSYTLDQGVLDKLGLGRKGRAYLLVLLRMNKLSAETVNGSVLFQVRNNRP